MFQLNTIQAVFPLYFWFVPPPVEFQTAQTITLVLSRVFINSWYSFHRKSKEANFSKFDGEEMIIILWPERFILRSSIMTITCSI